MTNEVRNFLASLTIPEKDLWVNLSPYEKDRIIPQSFGLTEMGRDLLAEDYMLKQITASLIYPEGETGKRFWKRIYEEAAKKFGTTDIPVNTFNKVWIIPEKAVVYENAKAGTAYVVESKLKVMLEQDYLSLQKHEGIQSVQEQTKDTNQLGSQIVREIVIPELTKEVNEDKNFVKLRQVYNSLILATWYKKKIKDSVLEQVYADKNKTLGVRYTSTVIPMKAGIKFKNDVEGLYKEYLRAFKKGVYNYIKEEIDPISQQMIPRKYFSGGVVLDLAMRADKAMVILDNPASLAIESNDNAMLIDAIAVGVNERKIPTGIHITAKIQEGLEPKPLYQDFEKPWNIGDYSRVHEPVDIGRVKGVEEFSNQQGVAILDMLIKAKGKDEIVIPEELAQFRGVIQQIFNHARTINPNLKGYRAYLSVDQRPIEVGKTQRIPGAHVDGFQGDRQEQKVPPELTYVVSDKLPTIFYRQPFFLSHVDVTQDNVFKEIQKQADIGKSWTPKPYEIYLMNSYVAHAGGVAKESDLRSGEQTLSRTFLRLEFVHPDRNLFDRRENTINPLMIGKENNYPWRMVNREVPQNLGNYDDRAKNRGLSPRVARDLDTFLNSLKIEDLSGLMEDLQRVRQMKIRGETGELAWIANLSVEGKKKDRISQIMKDNPDIFNPFFEAFHNQVYLAAKKSLGTVYVSATNAKPAILESLLKEGAVENSESVRRYINKYSLTQHVKVYRSDIIDVERFAQAFGITDENVIKKMGLPVFKWVNKPTF